jgi:pimeloyl-ACP methyl ester carboxylesterase/DNA-binding winged helix-turn-helix (wHTH) protein
MEDSAQSTYVFDKFRLETSKHTLSECGRAIPLRPKIYDALVMLVQNAGHVLRKDEMLARLWGDRYVEENNLSQSVAAIRRVLHETPRRKFIQTVSKFGYRFVAPVETIDPPTGDPWTGGLGCLPKTRYLRNGDVNIAYQVLGDGPIDLVFVMGWVSHLEYFWKQPQFAAFLRKLSSFSRLILFDQRGTGLSDRVTLKTLPTVDERIDDVRAVLDAVGSDRAVLCGLSGSGPMHSLFASAYPERTAGLIMLGASASNVKDGDYPWAPSVEEWEAFFEKLQDEWGGPVAIEQVAPSMTGDPEFRAWYAEYLRMAASPASAAAISRMNSQIDVRRVLPHISVPTLIMHRKDDSYLRPNEGRYVASLIPKSKYIELAGKDHFPFLGDQDEIVDEIEDFLNEVAVRRYRPQVYAPQRKEVVRLYPLIGAQ